MLKISLFELFLRGIPEGFLLVLAIYAFCKKKIDGKRYVIASVILFTATYLIRRLPINYGVHTLISILVLIGLCTKLCQLPLMSVIKSALLVTMILFILEACNVMILQIIYKDALTVVLNDPIQKALVSFPSTVLFAIVILLCYRSMNKHNRLHEKSIEKHGKAC